MHAVFRSVLHETAQIWAVARGRGGTDELMRQDVDVECFV